MPEITISQLKNHTAEIMRQIRETGMRYTITHRGCPIAGIVPIEEAQAMPQAETSAWNELISLGQQISKGWQAPQTSAEILSDMRR